jgi:hypothetical protein
MENEKGKKNGKKAYVVPKLKKYVFLKKEFIKYEGMATPTH